MVEIETIEAAEAAGVAEPLSERPASVPAAASRYGSDRFLNRELSWLDFASRLLDLAEDHSLPLLERVKFFAIFSTGLDEFFQVRVAGLKDQVAAGFRSRSPDGRRPAEQLRDIREKVLGCTHRADALYNVQLLPELSAAGVHIVPWDSLGDEDRAALLDIFETTIFPVLTPLAVDPSHPFPYISNLSLNLAVLVADPDTGEERFARVKVPPLLPRFVPLGDSERFVLLEQVIAANLPRLFPDMVVGAHHTFRVTRNADLALEESEADDLLEAVEIELRRRRFGRSVRLEVDRSMPHELRELLISELELGPADVYESSAPIDLGQLWAIHSLERPDLLEAEWSPITQPGLATAGDGLVDLFAVVREHDLLVHLPYDSFTSSVEAFIAQAAADPNVLAIKQTLYRTSGDTPVVSALISAAELGKQVVVLVELKARFDEQANIAWAKALEQAGVHVVYGFIGLKTHSKTLLVVRREEDGIRRYCHIGTGNYNSETARIYEDLGLLTADPDVGADLTDLFNFLTGFSRPSAYRKIVLAPQRFRPWVLEQIAAEADKGPRGCITIKINGLNDPEVIDALYAASQAGTRIDLVVRGICCLRPGVPGLSETITVRSIVGRFLEHSRIYRFGGRPVVDGAGVTAPAGAEGGGDGAEAEGPASYWIGSGDLMDRNLDRRVEALVPVIDPELCERLETVLELNLTDDSSAWSLGPDGSWTRVPTREGVSAQASLRALARERGRRRRSPDALAVDVAGVGGNRLGAAAPPA